MTSFDCLDQSSVPEPECWKVGRAAQPIHGFAVISIAHGELLLQLADGGGARLLEADLLIVPDGAHVEARARQMEAEVVGVRFSPRWLEAAFALAGYGPNGHLPRLVTIQRGSTDLARRGVRLLRRISSEPEFAATRAPLRFVSTLLELVALGAEAEPGAAKPVFLRRTRTDSLLETLAAIQSEPLEGLSLPALAARLAVSERQASRLFQDALGMSFRAWATQLRLDRARRLLAQTDLPIIEVAGETGWSSLAHFNSVFRRRSGSTPSRYRRLHRTECEDSTAPSVLSARFFPLAPATR